jgi:hypothetical protein
MHSLPIAQQTALVNRVRQQFFTDQQAPDHGAACLFWSMVAAQVIGPMLPRHRHLLQAGTAWFRRLPAERDAEQTEITHFGYQFDADSTETRLRVHTNHMPEMHVWVADVTANQIIDVTTLYQPALCRQLLNLDWQFPIPDYLWGGQEPLQECDARYIPDPRACLLAAVMAEYARRGPMEPVPHGELYHKWQLACRRIPAEQRPCDAR